MSEDFSENISFDETDKTIEEPQDKKENIITSISVLPTELERTLSQALNLSDDNILHEPTCLICSSPYRKEIEDKWIETKDYQQVKNVLKDSSKNKISSDVIDNHMRFHFERGIKQLQIKEYINKIKRFSTSDLTTLDRIQFALATLTERIIEINAITPSGDYSQADIEKIKSSELTKLMGVFGKFTKMQADLMGEMKSTGDLISIPKTDFISFFNRVLTEAGSEKEKDIINKILSQLASLSQS